MTAIRDKLVYGSKVEWNGGKCPVSGKQGVRVYLRDGRNGLALARHITWQHSGDGEDVVAYRTADEGE